MAKSISELLNNKESRDRILAKAKAEVGGGGLLDMIPTYRPDTEKQKPVCGKCNRMIDANATVCPHCKTPFTNRQQKTPQKRG